MNAAEAWGTVMAAVREYGWPREAAALASMDRDVMLLVQAIGWQRICMATPGQLINERNWFCRAWELKRKGVA